MNDTNLQVVIMAGGRGTRIQSIASDIPKPMIRVCGVPVLEHQLKFFSRAGIKNVTISIGYLGTVIKDYFGDGNQFGVHIDYIEENEPLGTAGALRFLSDKADLFLIVNGDILFDFDLYRMLEYHNLKSADATLFTHPNQHPYDSAVIDANVDGRIVRWFNKEEERSDVPNRVNAGIHMLSRDFLDFGSEIWRKSKVDLDRDILKPNISRKKIFAYDSPEYVKDMGTPERYHRVSADFESGIISAKNLKNRQKAIFIDRDGTINEYVGYVNCPEQLELIDGVSEALRLINQSSYIAIIASNQPVIARGECSFDEMKRIHDHLQMLLGMEGVYVDDIIFCPHHPDKGFAGEVTELKFDCDCRKPKPGMLLKMAEKYNIDLSQSYMIGDSLRDVEAGIAAGCQSIYIGEESVTNCHCSKDLLEAVKYIFRR
ncbi:MAG: HAD-IIIA family hydrolase [Selenomonadaceae bacterium]|nr:HAD-IIIA family hydrolase [Selenomonadaceae bacterium]